MANVKQLVEAARHLIEIRAAYSRPPASERTLDPVLYAYLGGRYLQVTVSRQHKVRFANSSRASRIDYRIGGNNPAMIEFVVRPPDGGSQLYGKPNLKELKKLSKFPWSRARMRALLLLDLSDAPIPRSNLMATYDPLHAGRGKKQRNTVTVVYVHEVEHYSFSWDPYKG